MVGASYPVRMVSVSYKREWSVFLIRENGRCCLFRENGLCFLKERMVCVSYKREWSVFLIRENG